MDSTETARRLLGHDGRTPIYTALVAEWRAGGRTVPEHRDGPWASFAAATAGERATVPPVPFPVPVPLLRPPPEDTREELTSPPDPPAPR
ncbi:hypothetical protein [Streptomyces caelestis]|uniref:hypothetical protein n=1 Tax=Streptomyces caelestis TaxID=36816 RepID=UPI00364C7F5A